jgi:hypothetical protein
MEEFFFFMWWVDYQKLLEWKGTFIKVCEEFIKYSNQWNESDYLINKKINGTYFYSLNIKYLFIEKALKRLFKKKNIYFNWKVLFKFIPFLLEFEFWFYFKIFLFDGCFFAMNIHLMAHRRYTWPPFMKWQVTCC